MHLSCTSMASCLSARLLICCLALAGSQGQLSQEAQKGSKDAKSPVAKNQTRLNFVKKGVPSKHRLSQHYDYCSMSSIVAREVRSIASSCPLTELCCVFSR